MPKQTTLWDVLTASKGLPPATPLAAIWGRKLAGGYTVETYTGALPVTLEGTVAGNLISYKIWGNTGGVGVKKTNLAEGEQLLEHAAMGSDGHMVSSSQSIAFRLIPVVEGKEYSIVNIYGAETSESSNFYAFFEELPQIGSVSYDGHRYSFKTSSRTFVAPITGYLATSDYYPMYEEQHSNLIPLEVYEGNASPYYLPMDVHGIENLFDIEKVATGSPLTVDGTTIIKANTAFNYDIFSRSAGASAALTTSCMILEAETYTLSYEILEGQRNMFLVSVCPYTSETMLPETQYFDGYSGKTFVLSEKSYVTLRIGRQEPQSVKNLMITKGSTAPSSYIPYAPPTNTPIYIGREALEKGEYVDSESGKIYRMVDGVLSPTDPPEPLPQIPTFAPTTTISYGGTGAQPEKVELKYKKSK